EPNRSLPPLAIHKRQIIQRKVADEPPGVLPLGMGGLGLGRRAADAPNRLNRSAAVRNKIALGLADGKEQRQIAIGAQSFNSKLPQVSAERRRLGIDER